MALFLLLVLAAPLPADVWSVGSNGKSCVQLDKALAEELATWREDPDSSVPGEGVYGRVNPKNARQLVLLFSSKSVCERIVWAVKEEAKDNRPSRTLDDKQVREKVEALAVTGLAKVWPKLSAKEKKALHVEAKALFAGEANQVRVRKRIAELMKKKKPIRAQRARLHLWTELYAIVFGEPYAEETETDQ